MPLQKSQMHRLMRIAALLKENRYPNSKTLVKEFKRIALEEDLEIDCVKKTILRDMMKSTDKSIILTKEAGNTQYQMEKGFIFQPQQIIEYSTDNELRATYNPQPWLMELYNKNPGILEQEKHDDRK